MFTNPKHLDGASSPKRHLIAIALVLASIAAGLWIALHTARDSCPGGGCAPLAMETESLNPHLGIRLAQLPESDTAHRPLPIWSLEPGVGEISFVADATIHPGCSRWSSHATRNQDTLRIVSEIVHIPAPCPPAEMKWERYRVTLPAGFYHVRWVKEEQEIYARRIAVSY